MSPDGSTTLAQPLPFVGSPVLTVADFKTFGVSTGRFSPHSYKADGMPEMLLHTGWPSAGGPKRVSSIAKVPNEIIDVSIDEKLASYF